MTAPYLAALAALLAPPPAGMTRHETPAQHVAAKALAGDYGKLAAWQHKGYSAILRGTEPRLLVVTGYWPGEAGGTYRAVGGKCRPGTLASNKLPRWAYVYTPSWGRLFRVEDCGSKRNDRRNAVTKHGPGAVWADVWLASSSQARGRCNWTPTRAEVTR